MGFYTRTRVFQNNADPIGGGLGARLNHDVLNEYEQAHQTASDALDAVDSRLDALELGGAPGSGGGVPKQSVTVCATTDVPVATAPSVIDGITLSIGARVLLAGQTVPAENGIYVFAGPGSPLTRAADADSDADLRDAFVFVNFGSQAQAGWRNTAAAPIVVETTAQPWVQFAAPTTATQSQLNDSGGNPVVLTAAAASPVNQITAGNAATGGNPYLAATGADANINLGLRPKGAGAAFVENVTADANLTVTATSTNRGAYLNLISTSAAFNAVSGWVSGVAKWRIGRAGGTNGVTVYTLDGATPAAQFRDDQSTLFFGPTRTAVYSTGTRPAAATAGQGAQIFDSTLNKPLWSTGTVWVDAAGTAV